MCVKEITIVVYKFGNVNAREGGADNRHLENGVFRNVSWHLLHLFVENDCKGMVFF